MRTDILKALKLLNGVLEQLEASEALPPKRAMTIEEFKEFLGDKCRATTLAKHCKIGHSVFTTIISGKAIPVMRESTKARILAALNIEIL